MSTFGIAVRQELHQRLSKAASACHLSMGELIGGTIAITVQGKHAKRLEKFVAEYRAIPEKRTTRPYVQISLDYKEQYEQLRQQMGVNHAELGYALVKLIVSDLRIARAAIQANAARQQEKISEFLLSYAI